MSFLLYLLFLTYLIYIAFCVTESSFWCEHALYTEDESKKMDWIKPGSEPHVALLNIVKNKQLVQDLYQTSENISTSGLEIFHPLKIRYLPKGIFFEKDKMMTSTAVAVMHHNLNVDRRQVSQFDF